MAAYGYMAHADPAPPVARSAAERLQACGYAAGWGENIAAGQTTATAVFNAWKASSGHNANMLNPNFKVIGIGMAQVAGSPYGTYWTTGFGGVVDAAPVC